MNYKRIKCPGCGQKVSSLWYYLSSPYTKHTCSNCKTRIKWHPIIFFYNLIFAICMIGGYNLLKDVFDPPYIGGIIGVIVGIVIYTLIPKKVKIVEKKDWISDIQVYVTFQFLGRVSNIDIQENYKITREKIRLSGVIGWKGKCKDAETQRNRDTKSKGTPRRALTPSLNIQ